MIQFKAFSITGSPSKTIYDPGLISTSEEKKRLHSILIQVSDYDDDVYIEGYLERQKIFDIPSSFFDTTASTASTNTQKSFNRIIEVEVGVDLPIGTKFQASILCGPTPINLKGAYRYEVIK